MIDEARLQELLDEATIDCYDEEEEFAGLMASLSDHISFPLLAELAGTKVEVLGLDEATSNPYRGIRARVRRNDKEFLVSLADLEFDNPDETSAEWLALYTWVAERL